MKDGSPELLSRSVRPARQGAASVATLGDAFFGFGVAIVSGTFALSVLLVLQSGADDGLAGLAVGALATWLAFIGMPLVVSRHRGTGRLAQDFGLQFRLRDGLIGVPIGVATQLVLLPLIYAVLGRFIDTSSVSEPANNLVSRGSGIGLAVVFLIVGVGAPIAEELFYRGLFQRAAISRLGTAPGVLLVATLFGAAHLQPLQFPGLFAAGLVFGFLAWRTGRLGASIAAHAGFNLVAAAVVVFS